MDWWEAITETSLSFGVDTKFSNDRHNCLDYDWTQILNFLTIVEMIGGINVKTGGVKRLENWKLDVHSSLF